MVQYSIVSETSSTRLRPLSVVLARTSYQLINIVSQVLEPYMMVCIIKSGYGIVILTRVLESNCVESSRQKRLRLGFDSVRYGRVVVLPST